MKLPVYDFGVHDFEPQVIQTLESVRQRTLDHPFKRTCFTTEYNSFDKWYVWQLEDVADEWVFIGFSNGGIVGRWQVPEVHREKLYPGSYTDFHNIPPEGFVTDNPQAELMLLFYNQLRSMFGAPLEMVAPNDPAFDPYRYKRLTLPEHLMAYLVLEQRTIEVLEPFGLSDLLRAFGLPNYWYAPMNESLNILLYHYPNSGLELSHRYFGGYKLKLPRMYNSWMGHSGHHEVLRAVESTSMKTPGLTIGSIRELEEKKNLDNFEKRVWSRIMHHWIRVPFEEPSGS